VQFDLHVEYDREKVIETTVDEIWAASAGQNIKNWERTIIAG
jgi:hypothetical protein